MASLDEFRAFAIRVGRYARPVLIFAAYLLPIGLMINAITFWGHGIIDSEAMEFVLNYLQKRPFFAQIFDPALNDWGAYQARELSYVFDRIDARVFATLLDRHLLLFIPLSGVVGLISVSAIYWWGSRKVLALNGVMASMLLSLFLSCIVVQTSTPILYRSSKVLLSVALLAFLFYTFSLLQRDQRDFTDFTILFFLGLVMPLCDRQGFYYLISATFIVAMLWIITKVRKQSRDRAYLPIVVVNAASTLGTILYNRILAPALIHSLNGYWPNFSYQNLPWSKLLDPGLPAQAFHIFRDQVSFFFGNIPFLVLALLTIFAALAIFWKRRAAIKIDNVIIILVSLLSILAIIGLLAAMIARHPELYTIRDHEFWYYTLSVHVVILFGVSAWISFLNPRKSRFDPLLYALIAILIASNIRCYTQQRKTITVGNGWFAGQYEHSRALAQQFATSLPDRDKLLSDSSDLFLNDQAHFLENVERSYLHLTGALPAPPKNRP